MAENRIPQGGLRRPRPKLAPINVATSTTQHESRDSLGRYRIWYTKEDRYLRPMQIGATCIYVVDDFGDFVLVGMERAPWA